MTQTQLAAFATSVVNAWVTRMIVKFTHDVTRHGETEARKIWREEYGLVFRREYTVPARFNHYKKVVWDDLPANSKRTLEAQKKKKD